MGKKGDKTIHRSPYRAKGKTYTFLTTNGTRNTGTPPNGDTMLKTILILFSILAALAAIAKLVRSYG